MSVKLWRFSSTHLDSIQEDARSRLTSYAHRLTFNHAYHKTSKRNRPNREKFPSGMNPYCLPHTSIQLQTEPLASSGVVCSIVGISEYGMWETFTSVSPGLPQPRMYSTQCQKLHRHAQSYAKTASATPQAHRVFLNIGLWDAKRPNR